MTVCSALKLWVHIKALNYDRYDPYRVLYHNLLCFGQTKKLVEIMYYFVCDFLSRVRATKV